MLDNKYLWNVLKKNILLLNDNNWEDFKGISNTILSKMLPTHKGDITTQDFFDEFNKVFVDNTSWVDDFDDIDTSKFEFLIGMGDYLYALKEERINIQGFPCVFSDLTEEELSQYYPQIEFALSSLVKMFKHKLPSLKDFFIPLHFGKESILCRKNVLGCYSPEHKIIEVNLIRTLRNNKVNAIKNVLAHEIGHHIFRTKLSDKAIKFWYDFVNGMTIIKTAREVLGESDNYALAIKEIFKQYESAPEDRSLVLNLHEKATFLLKFQKDLNFSFKNSPIEIHNFIKENLDTPITIHKKPTTVYANENPEEAFCDFLYLLANDNTYRIDPIWMNYFEVAMGLRINKFANKKRFNKYL
jgi:hypothetical protein